jgi:hypothetical protein
MSLSARLFTGLVSGGIAVASASAQAADAGAPSSLPACVQVATRSRYVPFGYNHIVAVTNGCTRAATCSVATDVNPEAQSVEVASNATAEVLTFMASPSSTFVARVSCRLK